MKSLPCEILFFQSSSSVFLFLLRRYWRLLGHRKISLRSPSVYVMYSDILCAAQFLSKLCSFFNQTRKLHRHPSLIHLKWTLKIPRRCIDQFWKIQGRRSPRQHIESILFFLLRLAFLRWQGFFILWRASLQGYLHCKIISLYLMARLCIWP